MKALRKDVKVIKKTVATKKDLSLLRRAFKRKIEMTHYDLDERIRRLVLEIVKNSHDVRDLKSLNSAVAEMRENVWLILNRINALPNRQ